jgi:chromosome segregation protein
MPLLKTLELHGYKTFASRTPFEFPGMITAVVGPNGSGKSNIADSLRWVLGEQSYSLLRGRKTEDMIFSGSELRPRAGMASATVVFNNDAGWLPIDFSEVAITRRAYRDGQNEYLLNGQRVRLKEIHELLAQSGLAERTYTIIGQGLVDAALSLKPEERRRFFEEAAGIGLYRTRREEALNRLDTTRRNLERVLDILAELEPRLNSLEKQARRAMEYEQVRADLRVLLRDWYGYHWHRSQQEMAHSREQLHVQEEYLLKARERQMGVEAAANSARLQLTGLRGQLNTWHGLSAGLHTRREQVSRALAVMDERKHSLQERRQAAHSDLVRLEDEQKARLERMAELEEEREHTAQEAAEAEERIGLARKALEARQNERAQVEGVLRDLRKALVQAETRQVQLKAHCDELNMRSDQLRANQTSLRDALARDGEDLQRAEARLQQWAQNRALAEEEQKQAEETLRALRGRLSGLEEELRKARGENSRLETERSRGAAQLEVLEQSERSLSGLAEGARFLLQEAKQGRLRGSYQALAGRLIVPGELETAVAAALGEFIDSVLLDPLASLEDALSTLAKGEKGRAVLLPPGLFRSIERVQPPADPGCRGNAAELVRPREGAEAAGEALRLLLGATLVVNDRAAALRILPGLPGHARVVTLQGEVFLASGAVIAGKEQKGAAASASLGRARRMEEQRAVLKGLDELLGKSREALKSVEAQLLGERRQENDLESTARQAGQAFARANQSYQQVHLEVEQIKQKHEFQTRQLSVLEGQIQKSQAEVVQVQKELEETGRKVAEWNEKIREQNRLLANLPLDELQGEVVHWNTAVALSGRSLREADRRMAEQTASIQAGRKQAESLTARLGESEDLLAKLETERTTALADETRLNGEIDAMRVQIEPAEARLSEQEEETAHLQENLVTAQQAVAVAERHVSQAQIELSRHRDAVDSLRRKVEEDFGLVAFEFIETPGQAPLPLEGMVEQLPRLIELPPDLDDNINRQRGLMRRMGLINPEVQNEYKSVKDRFEFLTSQVADLRKADTDLRQVIAELDELMKLEFRRTFDAVAHEFKGLFTRLFGGGSARLVLSDAESTADMGIDIEARLPGRRDQGLSLLSGGERSLTAVALIFSLLKVSPTPFCVMDEVDAMLDEANVGRFRDLLMELAQKTQFILITHNRNTVQAADVIYGVTMGRDSASQVISLRLDELSEEMVK